jgi:hypothetical protein
MIMPCCGLSSRFPGLKKQFMIHPSGMPLPIFSASGISDCAMHVFVFLEHEFNEIYGSKFSFENKSVRYSSVNTEVVLLKEQTVSQVETVRQAIDKMQIRSTPIFIKDNDNYFQTFAYSRNFVNVVDVHSGDFELRNKSFSCLEDGSVVIERIQERGLISDYVNSGGYGFQNSDTFMKFSMGMLSITGVIRNIMNAGGEFEAVHVSEYKDYGTMKSWIDYLYKNFA